MRATTGIPWKPYEGLHIMFYTRRSTCSQKNASYLVEAHTNERFISCDGHQLYAFKGWGVDLEVEDVCYIEMHCGSAPYVLGPPPSRGGDLELEGGVNVSF